MTPAMRCRDELVEMMVRRVRRTQAAAKERLEALHDQHRKIEEILIGILGQLLATAQGQDSDDVFGRQIREILAERGGVEALTLQSACCIDREDAVGAGLFLPFGSCLHAA